MGQKAEAAAVLFDSGRNCAQSVLGAFCGGYGIDKETAFRMVCGLGSGARSADLCGAVSGAVLVIGLKYGVSKEMCNTKTEAFIRRFREENGTVVCRELLGCDITTAEGREKAISENLFTTRCAELVNSAASILEEEGY
ncbi:MAG: C-GCAxxG-C-C family protein [Oscillospiraceae bacterium]|nr:C-GCAxxG-C-C family protein [Oscillospiraceae bacterium]